MFQLSLEEAEALDAALAEIKRGEFTDGQHLLGQLKGSHASRAFGSKVATRTDRHIRAAHDWWSHNRPSAPTMFLEDLELAFALIEQFPNPGERVSHRRIANLRRVLLSRVQYSLYYCSSEDAAVVEVLALWHSKRGSKPKTMSDRSVLLRARGSQIN